MLENGKDLSKGVIQFTFEITQKRIFRFWLKILQSMDEVKHFFCQFSNPWALKCEKIQTSLHPNGIVVIKVIFYTQGEQPRRFCDRLEQRRQDPLS
jgi:hypothetical protein